MIKMISEYFDECNLSAHKEIEKFIFETIIPEVLNSVMPEIEEHICRFNDGECKCECFVKFEECIKQKSKELYNITL